MCLNGLRRFLEKWRMTKAYVAGDYDKVVASAQRLLHQHPDDIMTLLTIADVSHRQGNLDGALQYGERAIEVDPGRLEGLQLLAEVCFARGDFDTAYANVCKALEVAEKMNDNFGSSIESILRLLSTKGQEPPKARSLYWAIKDDQVRTAAWVGWAMEFKQWYESNK